MSQLELFIEALKDENYWEKVGKGFSLLEPGDWNAVVNWGTDCGYDFNLKDLLEFAENHPEIFNGVPKASPAAKWNLETLRASINDDSTQSTKK